MSWCDRIYIYQVNTINRGWLQPRVGGSVIMDPKSSGEVSHVGILDNIPPVVFAMRLINYN
jgi:hypothetical protein